MASTVMDCHRQQIPATYSYGQAAKILGVSSQTVFRMVRRGEIVPIYVHSRPRVPLWELERILAHT